MPPTWALGILSQLFVRSAGALCAASNIQLFARFPRGDPACRRLISAGLASVECSVYVHICPNIEASQYDNMKNMERPGNLYPFYFEIRPGTS
jgi:hypothetical protein